MWVLSLELGSDTESWCAEFALRRRVSMSATGSVIVMSLFPLFIRFRLPLHDSRPVMTFYA